MGYVTEKRGGKMRVLVLPSWYPNAKDKINGSFFQEQAKLIHNSPDTDVKILICRFPTRPSTWSIRQPIKTFLNILKIVCQIRTISDFKDDETLTSPPLLEINQSTLNPIKRFRYKQRIRVYLRAFDELLSSGWRPDILHAHTVKMGGLAAYHISKKYDIPYVITEHSPFHLANFPKFMRREIKDAFSTADQVLSLGYDKVRQLGMSDIHVEPRLIYNFVDETIFEKVCAAYQPSEKLRIISIGAASPLKDHSTLLKALYELKQRKINFQLTLAGLKIWGSEYNAILKKIADLTLQNEIRLVDRIDRQDVPSHMKGHNCFVITSIAEGLPVSVLEAQACGLFVVATRHGGTEDILTPNTGALAEVKNHTKIADHLENLYRGKIKHDPRLIRQQIISTCGTEAFRNRQISFYKQAINCHEQQRQS
ncbi:MAG: glycosyltransferase [Gammaproteobacteria bacterium]|nr:glycosyltransferase [Gammaproteobacteria bacterium]